MKTQITIVLMFATSIMLAAAAPQDGRHARGMGMLDTDGDGQVTLEEFEAAHQARFAQLDKDGNGVLTEDEFRGQRMRGKRAGQRGARLLFIADTDKDRQITSEELENFLAQVVAEDGETIDHEKVVAFVGNPPNPERRGFHREPPTASEIRTKFTELDADGNGAVDLTEIPRRGPRHRGRGMGGLVILKAADSDGQIGITADEWIAFLEGVANEDGTVEIEALLAIVHANRPGRGPEDGPHPLARVLDHDDDGTLTTADLDAFFAKLDANGDGAITEDELPRGRRGGQGRRGR